MKRITALMLVLALVLSLAACSAPAAETEPADTIQTAQATDTSMEEPLPTPGPTLTPTLSPEEMANRERYETLKGYFENYGDEYAVVLLEEMYSNWEITAEDWLAVAEPHPLIHIGCAMTTLESVYNWEKKKNEFEWYARVLNGNEYHAKIEHAHSDYGAVKWHLDGQAEHKDVYLSLYDSEVVRGQIAAGVDLIRKWYDDPTDENRLAMERLYFDEALPPEAIAQLYSMMWHWGWYKETGSYENDSYEEMADKLEKVTVNGTTYEYYDYIMDVPIELYGQSMGERWGKAVDSIVERNTIPPDELEEEKLQETEPMEEMPEVIPDISKMETEEELQFYWERYNDAFAVLKLVQMYDDGEMTNNSFTETTMDFANADYMKSTYEMISNALNGGLEDLSMEDRYVVLSRILHDINNEKYTISLFDTNDKRMRIWNAIRTINQWHQDPNEDNTKSFEALFSAEDVTDGEIVFMQLYARSGPYLDEEKAVHIEGKEYGFPYSVYGSDYFFERKIDDEHTLNELLEIASGVVS